MRFPGLTAFAIGALSLALNGACRADEPERELISLAPEDAGTEGAADLPPIVAKACLNAGLAAGSTGHRQCGLELISILRAPRGSDLGPLTPPARLDRGLNLGAACARYFPAASRREREEGTATLLVYVAPDHRVKEAIRWQSSGSDRLDLATASCMYREARFEPKLVDHAPVGSWQRLKYTWRLRG